MNLARIVGEEGRGAGGRQGTKPKGELRSAAGKETGCEGLVGGTGADRADLVSNGETETFGVGFAWVFKWEM